MEFSQHDEDNNYSLTKFESMLKTNNVLFFDSNEFENIIQFYFENGRMALAKKAIKLGLEQHPSSIVLRLFQVEIYILEDKLPQAEKLLDELYILEPSNEEIYIQKASILSKRDQHEKAIDTLKIALKLSDADEEDADLYALIGMEYLFMDQFENAKTYFIKCLELDMEDYSALYNIIYCFEFLDLNEEAIDFLNHYLDKNPYCEVAWHQLGKQYATLKDYPKALSAFEFAIISDDTFVGAYLEKGKVLEKMKKYEEAIENYNVTLALDEPTSFALLRIGNCYEKLGSDDLAVQYYFKTVHEDPLLDKGWISITRFYNKKKDYQKALYYINKAISIDAENVRYWKLYAQINHRLNFIEEAERGYKKTLDLGNYELDTWLARTDALIKLGEYEASALNLIQAAEFYPENAEIEYRLAGIYFTLFENEKGQYHLKNGLLIDEDYNFILQELFPLIADHQMVVKIISNSKKTSK
ncbi:tetratricopeptide repeat protein [Gelidibacter salicanalis]|uniref:Tetratricopeptide repeat protein n=1 Tax=Gelidibacter salicanalis TaxID=291193 RepID=A0A5C7AUS6_9FLAO|nr:tetratricopeptide repeat protein [Gelidibacter salicanalis]TXE09512.1 tetratricopeptide repeat protein [Gelidibacter salicanalis]